MQWKLLLFLVICKLRRLKKNKSIGMQVMRWWQRQENTASTLVFAWEELAESIIIRLRKSSEKLIFLTDCNIFQWVVAVCMTFDTKSNWWAIICQITCNDVDILRPQRTLLPVWSASVSPVVTTWCQRWPTQGKTSSCSPLATSALHLQNLRVCEHDFSHRQLQSCKNQNNESSELKWKAFLYEMF